MKTCPNRLDCYLYSLRDWIPTSWKRALASMALAGAIVLAGIVSGCKPSQPPVTPPPITQSTPTPQPTIILNPAEEYAKSLGLSGDIVSMLKPLGEDGEMNDDEKSSVDLAYKITRLGTTQTV